MKVLVCLVISIVLCSCAKDESLYSACEKQAVADFKERYSEEAISFCSFTLSYIISGDEIYFFDSSPNCCGVLVLFNCDGEKVCLQNDSLDANYCHELFDARTESGRVDF